MMIGQRGNLLTDVVREAVGVLYCVSGQSSDMEGFKDRKICGRHLSMAAQGIIATSIVSTE